MLKKNINLFKRHLLIIFYCVFKNNSWGTYFPNFSKKRLGNILGQKTVPHFSKMLSNCRICTSLMLLIVINRPFGLPCINLTTSCKFFLGKVSVSQPISSDPSIQSGSPSQRQYFLTHSPSLHLNHLSGSHWASNPWAAPHRKITIVHSQTTSKRLKWRLRRAFLKVFVPIWSREKMSCKRMNSTF